MLNFQLSSIQVYHQNTFFSLSPYPTTTQLATAKLRRRAEIKAAGSNATRKLPSLPCHASTNPHPSHQVPFPNISRGACQGKVKVSRVEGGRWILTGDSGWLHATGNASACRCKHDPKRVLFLSTTLLKTLAALVLVAAAAAAAAAATATGRGRCHVCRRYLRPAAPGAGRG